MLNRRVVNETWNVLLLLVVVALVLLGLFMPNKARCEESPVEQIDIPTAYYVVGEAKATNVVTFTEEEAAVALDDPQANDATGAFVSTEEVEADPAQPTVGLVPMDGENPAARWQEEFEGDEPIAAPIAKIGQLSQTEAFYALYGMFEMYLLASLAAIALAILVLANVRRLDRRQNRRTRPATPTGTPRVCSDVDDDAVEADLGLRSVTPRLFAIGEPAIDRRLAEYLDRKRDAEGSHSAPFLLTNGRKKKAEVVPPTPNGAVN